MNSVSDTKLLRQAVDRRGQVFTERVVPAHNESHAGKASYHVSGGSDESQGVFLVVEPSEPPNQRRGFWQPELCAGLELTEWDAVAFKVQSAVDNSILARRAYLFPEAFADIFGGDR